MFDPKEKSEYNLRRNRLIFLVDWNLQISNLDAADIMAIEEFREKYSLIMNSL